MSKPGERDVVFITGGGRGFGRAMALAFAANGDAVTIMARSQRELDDTAATAAATGGQILAVTGDVTKAADVARAVAATEESFGAVSLLIHNAGVWSGIGPLWVVDTEKWWWDQKVHVLGAVNLIKATVPAMVNRGEGRVIIVSSIGARQMVPNGSSYPISKASQIQVAAHLAEEGREHGVNAFSIHPGGFLTQLVKDVVNSPEAQRWIPGFGKRSQRDPRPPEEREAETMNKCAQLCMALASGRYDGLSGQFLTPDDDLDALLALAK